MFAGPLSPRLVSADFTLQIHSTQHNILIDLFSVATCQGKHAADIDQVIYDSQIARLKMAPNLNDNASVLSLQWEHSARKCTRRRATLSSSSPYVVTVLTFLPRTTRMRRGSLMGGDVAL